VFLKVVRYFSVGASSSGRARSDPTHQHHSHLHVHSHSAHHGSGNQYPTMECESPGSQVGNTVGGSRSQYQQSWPPEASQGQSSGHHGNSTASSHVLMSGHRHPPSRPHHHHPAVSAQSPPSVNAPPNIVGPPQGVLLSGPVLTSSEQVVYGSRTAFPSQGLSMDMVQSGHHSHANIDPSLNMQLPGYPQQYGQYSQQTWPGPGFPFTLTPSSGGTEPPSGHTRTVTERSDDSPMVGVIVQQSPVVIH
jgi:dual specificity tyrosine-phosphorylation-regulated kinase 1